MRENVVTCDICKKLLLPTKNELPDSFKTHFHIPIDTVAEMLAELFGDECCCNYNGIDEWLPFLCEHSDTCPDTIDKNGCWKQFIKHWMVKKDGK